MDSKAHKNMIRVNPFLIKLFNRIKQSSLKTWLKKRASNCLIKSSEPREREWSILTVMMIMIPNIQIGLIKITNNHVRYRSSKTCKLKIKITLLFTSKNQHLTSMFYNSFQNTIHNHPNYLYLKFKKAISMAN